MQRGNKLVAQDSLASRPKCHRLNTIFSVAAGIELAAKDGVEWILHIDTDELVYPGGGPEYSIQRVLAGVPADVDTIVFPNYESLPERDDVQDPFTEVSPPSPQPYCPAPLLRFRCINLR